LIDCLQDTVLEMPQGEDVWMCVKPIHKYIDEEFYMKRPARNVQVGASRWRSG